MKENEHPHIGMPHTIPELKLELEEAEREMDDPDKWCTSEQMWADVKREFPWARRERNIVARPL